MTGTTPYDPGWHADPTGRHTHRYHDGRGWTQHVADDGRQSLDTSGLDYLNAPAPGAPVREVTPAVPKPEPGASAAGFWVAGVLGVITVLAAIAVGIVGFVNVLTAPNDFDRGPIPGTVVTTVTHPGERTIYYEGGFRPTGEGLGLTVAGPDGAPVPVGGYGVSATYDIPGHSGRAVATFDARTAGRYRVTAAAAPEPGAKLAVGPDIASSLLWLFLRPILVLVGGGILAGIIALVTVYRRRRPPRETSGLT